MSGVVDYMREHEVWRLATENDSHGEMEAVTLDRDWEGDGLILFRATEGELREHRARGRAVVLISTEGPDLGYPRVIPDNAQAGLMAADHLIEGNHGHFAFLARGETFYREEVFAPGVRRYARERLRSFRERLKAYHHTPLVHYLRGRALWKPDTWRELQGEVIRFLSGLPKPCGLFVVDDALGAVVLRAADEMGLKVPEECAVIGFGDDLRYCYASCPALSSVRMPAQEIGGRAAELVQRQFAGEELDGLEVRVPVTKLSPRESSDTLAITDPEVRKLVRWIRQHAPHDPLRVTELCERSNLSMTTIKLRFGETLGHGPKEEIKRVRLTHLLRMLRDTELPLIEIAGQMGFRSAHELSRFFQAETGERPSRFRERAVVAAIPTATVPDERRAGGT